MHVASARGRECERALVQPYGAAAKPQNGLDQQGWGLWGTGCEIEAIEWNQTWRYMCSAAQLDAMLQAIDPAAIAR